MNFMASRDIEKGALRDPPAIEATRRSAVPIANRDAPTRRMMNCCSRFIP